MAVAKTETTILLVRHGETDWNRDRRIQGHTDVPLNESGREQSRQLARELDGRVVDTVYSSDLSRALETATILAAGSGVPVRVSSELREKDFGSWEGLTREAVLERHPDARAGGWGAGGWGDGETTDEMSARVVTALREIVEAHAGGTVLVVTHGGPVGAVMRAAGISRDGPIENCSLLSLVVEDGEFRPID